MSMAKFEVYDPYPPTLPRSQLICQQQQRLLHIFKRIVHRYLQNEGRLSSILDVESID